MDSFKLAIILMAVTERHGKREGSRQGQRVMTAEELYAIADFEWPWAGPKNFVAACASAVRARCRPRASDLNEAPPPALEAMSQV
jgi:hypothetical protein